jgi:hypothetical protein
MQLLVVLAAGLLFWFCRAVIGWGFRELWRTSGEWLRLRMAEEQAGQARQKKSSPP